jgi:DNA polymerase-3 subunit beta
VKVRIERDVLAEAVAWAARSLPNRPSVPILAGLLIKAEGETVTLSSFDYETSAQVTIPAQVYDEGVVLVSGKLLSEIARSLPNEPVTMDTEETKVEILCGQARFTMQMLPVGDYPQLPQMPAATGTVESELFARSVAQVAVAAGRDELLPVFTGIRLEIDGETLSMLATDRYRMALKELPWHPADTQASGAAIVPGRVLQETARSMTSGEGLVMSLSNESMGDGLIGFEGDGGGASRQLTTRLLDGEFPKLRHLMEFAPNVSVRVKTEELVGSVRRVSLVAERNTPLRMMITEEQIALDAATGDQAQATENIEAIVVNHTTESDLPVTAVGFNPHYLSDALGALDTPFVQFSFTQPGQPCLVQGLADLDGDPEPSYRHVIMLMRLPE